MCTIIQWNANGIAAHLSELKRFLSQQASLPDIICIQESLLRKQNTKFRLNGYRIERADRDGHGGGLVTCIKDGLSYLRLPNPTSLEALVIQVQFESKVVKIVNTYHAPNKPLIDDQYRLLFQTFNRDTIILGDLNAYSTVFGALTTDNRGRLLEELIDEHNFVALNTGAAPTSDEQVCLAI